MQALLLFGLALGSASFNQFGSAILRNQGAAHQPGMAGHARQGGDLPVGRHPAPGNRGDDLPDPLLRSERLPGGLT